MTDTPEQFAARVAAAADAEGRLPLPAQAMWEIFPFEIDGLRTVPLRPPVLPEPPRAGEGGRPCRRCADPERGVVWSDERWLLVGMDSARLARTVRLRDVTSDFPYSSTSAQRSDLDHTYPWPRGQTALADLGARSRRIHRAKQAGWTPRPLPDGSLLWQSPSGASYRRPPPRERPPRGRPSRPRAPRRAAVLIPR